MKNKDSRSRQELIANFWAKRKKRVDKAISAFSVSHMSDTKWRKLFAALYEKRDLISGYQWGFVDEEVYPSPETTRVLTPDDLQDKHTADMSGIPIGMPYREIEFLVVLTDRPDELIEYLKSFGQFETLCMKDGFVVLGYE